MRHRPFRLLALVLAVVTVLGGLAGCQVRVTVDTHVERDGSGVVTVGVGLDEKAQTRVGGLDGAVRVGDLQAAGWQLDRPTREADGLTWLRARKPFASTDELNAALAEITGQPAVFHDFKLVREDAGTATTYHLSGTVDPVGGTARFGDTQLAARLGGDPLGTSLATIEQQEGQPVRSMVELAVSAGIGGDASRVWHPTLGDTAPTPVDLVVRDAKPATTLGGGAPLGLMAAAAVVVLILLADARRRFRRRAARRRARRASARSRW
jgi:hypothetical protein